jgi:hypothetical protein
VYCYIGGATTLASPHESPGPGGMPGNLLRHHAHPARQLPPGPSWSIIPGPAGTQASLTWADDDSRMYPRPARPGRRAPIVEGSK